MSYYRERRKIILFFFLFPSTKFVLLGLLFDFHPLYCVCVCVCVFFFSLALNCLGNCGDALVLHLSSSLQPSVRWNSNSLRVRSIVPRSHHSTCVCVLYIYTLTHTHTHISLSPLEMPLIESPKRKAIRFPPRKWPEKKAESCRFFFLTPVSAPYLSL